MLHKLIAKYRTWQFSRQARFWGTLDDWMIDRGYPRWKRRQAWDDIVHSPESRKALFMRLGKRG